MHGELGFDVRRQDYAMRSREWLQYVGRELCRQGGDRLWQYMHVFVGVDLYRQSEYDVRQ